MYFSLVIFLINILVITLLFLKIKSIKKRYNLILFLPTLILIAITFIPIMTRLDIIAYGIGSYSIKFNEAHT